MGVHNKIPDEAIYLAAEQCASFKEFRLTKKNYYYAALRRQLLPKILDKHKWVKYTGSGSKTWKWTSAAIIDLASTYSSLDLFKIENERAYRKALKLSIKDEVLQAIYSKKGDSNNKLAETKRKKTDTDKRWTKELIYEEARKYRTLHNFNKFSDGAYMAAFRLNLLNEPDFPLKKVEYQNILSSEIAILREFLGTEKLAELMDMTKGRISELCGKRPSKVRLDVNNRIIELTARYSQSNDWLVWH